MPPELSRDLAEFGDLPGIPRPREQTRLVGHEAATAAFVEAIGGGRLHHAWLISGPRGIGKATLAYHVARRLVADPAKLAKSGTLETLAEDRAARQVAALSHPNIAALRRAQSPGSKTLPTKISVDAVRQALELFGSTAGSDGYRVCIVDSAEDLNANSANALLKMVEEPPPRSLFLIVSHAPGRLLPTIRSRCRFLALRPLSDGQVRAVIESFPPPFAQPETGAIARAAASSEGSVPRAVALLDPAAVTLSAEIGALLADLRQPDWRRIAKLAESLGGRDSDDALLMLREALQRFVSEEIERRKTHRPAALVSLVEAADRIESSARAATVYNLDRRALVLSMFGELASVFTEAA